MTYPASFPVTRLYRKKSEKGATYFVGRLGGARLALLKSNETADDGTEVWHLMISPAPSATGAPARADPPQPERQPAPAPSRDGQRPDADADIPF
ncbi:MAG TPA: hypothetical protein VGF29_15330 [Hyphomicrobiaceae bacterium]|jgi:hypothetical protein